MSSFSRCIESLSPEERRAEVAQLLALGLVRWKSEQRRLGRLRPSENFDATSLEVPNPSGLSVPTG